MKVKVRTLISSETAGSFLVPPVSLRSFRRLAGEAGVAGSIIGKRKLFWTVAQIEAINDYRRSKPSSRL